MKGTVQAHNRVPFVYMKQKKFKYLAIYVKRFVFCASMSFPANQTAYSPTMVEKLPLAC